MSNARPQIRYRVASTGSGFVENAPAVTAESIQRLIPQNADAGSLHVKIIEAIANYVASTNEWRKNIDGRNRAERIAVLVNQLTEIEGLNDVQLAARLIRMIELRDNQERKPKGPFESSVNLRAYVLATVCEFLAVPQAVEQQQVRRGMQAGRSYVTTAGSNAGGAYVAAAMPRECDVRQEVRIRLAKAKLKQNENHNAPVQSQFVQDLLGAINRYQESTKYNGCCLYGRVKLWKQTGFDRSIELRKLILEDMVGTEQLSDDQIRTQLREAVEHKRHIGIFDSSRQLRRMITEVLNNELRQENRLNLVL